MEDTLPILVETKLYVSYILAAISCLTWMTFMNTVLQLSANIPRVVQSCNFYVDGTNSLESTTKLSRCFKRDFKILIKYNEIHITWNPPGFINFFFLNTSWPLQSSSSFITFLTPTLQF